MTIVVRLPKMGLTMEEARIARWVAEPGQIYKKGDPLVEVETDKSVLEVEMPQDGVIGELLVKEGDTVEVGTPLARLSDEEKTVPIDSMNIEKVEKIVEYQSNTARIILPISPSARRRARELGVDYTMLKGTGPNGRIIHKDVEEAAHRLSSAQDAVATEVVRKQEHKEGSTMKLTPMRRIIAKRMVESITTIPQFYIKRKVDVSKLLRLKDTIQESIIRSRNVKISFNDFIIRSIAEALHRYPQLNASFIGTPESKESHIVQHQDVNVGLAVATEDGLVVPVIHHADKLSVMEIAAVREQLVTETRRKTLGGEGMRGGTFTVSNLGSKDVEEFTAIVNPPESGILAVGSIVEEPVVIDGKIKIRPIVTMVGSFDHRVIDGLTAADFMQQVVENLESEDWLLF